MKNETHIENSKREMRRGMLEFSVMLIINRDTAYVSEILAELKKSDMILVEGTLYPLLSRLKSEGLLSYTWEESKLGPPRKYYALTDMGREKLGVLKETWKELSSSIHSLLK